jgi:hypothetical protein
MKFRDTRINGGGMMRCCTESLMKAKDLDDECAPGEIVACLYGHDPSHPHWILLKGIWLSNQNPLARSAS